MTWKQLLMFNWIISLGHCRVATEVDKVKFGGVDASLLLSSRRSARHPEGGRLLPKGRKKVRAPSLGPLGFAAFHRRDERRRGGWL